MEEGAWQSRSERRRGGVKRRMRRALVVLKAVKIHRTANVSILTLAGGAGGVGHMPCVSTEAGGACGILACLPDVVGKVVGQARVCDTARAALALRYCRVFAHQHGTNQRPAIHLPLHAAALLAAVQPGCSAAVERASTLVQTLAAGPVVTAGTAKQIFLCVFTVTGSPPAVCLAVLAGAYSTAVKAGFPVFSVASDSLFLWAVAAAARTGRTHAVVASREVHAHAVIPAGVCLQTALIDVNAGAPIEQVGAIVMETTSAFTVVPAGQVDTAGVVVALNQDLCALIDICLTVASRKT